jgi:WD40 repeat protein
MYVRYFDAERNYISKQAWSIVAEPVSVWFDQYVTAVVPEGARFAAIMFAGGNSKPYRYYVDDVKLLRGEHALPDVPLPDNSIVKVGQDLGPQIRKATLMRNAVGKDGQGRDVIYSVVAGSPSIFTMIDIETEKVTRSIPMPDTDGAWSVTVSSDGSVYLGAYNLGLLYRYLPATDELINLGHPFSTKDSVLYPMAAGKDGKMYGSTYPTAHLYEYNPATNQFKDFGTMSHRTSGERWTRVVTYDEATHKIYAGVGNVPRLLEYDLATGAKRELLPAGFDNIISVYDLNLAGGKLFARKEANNANETFVVDIKSGNMLEVTNGVTGEKTNAFTNLSRGVSPKSPIANKVYYAAAGGDLYEYDLDTDTYRPLGASIEGAAIGYDFVQLNEEGFPGYSLVGISGNSGKMYKYNLETGKVKLTDIQVPAEPVNIHDIAKGPDGKIYTAGYLQGNLGVHTPSTGESMYFEGISQGEGMTKIRNKMYLGIYPGAKIYEYDLSKPWNRTNSDQLNPNTLFSLSASNPPPNSYLYQDRPFGMGSAEELNKLFVGTVPKNAMLGGVLAVYDVETRGEPEVYWNIVPDQSILSFAYKNGFLYAGTSIHGGQGSTPTAKEAVLFIWDVVNKRKVFELVPVAGKQAITALHVGPDGNIWGLANGTLFILDIETRQIIHSNNAFPAASGRWIDGSMETGTDGNVYATVGGSFFKVDAATKEVTVLATQVGKLAQDDFGSFYMFNDPPGPNLYKYSTPELQLKLTGAELSAPATVLSVGGQTELKLKGLLERGRSTYELSGAVKTYTLSQPHIAQIDNGRLTALKPGNTDLTVTLMLDGVTVVSNTINLTIQEVPDTVTDTGTDTNTDNNTGGGTNIGSTPGSSSPTPPVEVGTDGSLTVGNQQVAIENGQAVVRISSSVLTNALQQLTEQTDQPGKALIIRVPEMTADQPLLVEFPAGALSSQTVEAIREIRVAAGKVELSLPMEQLLGAGQDEILAFRIAVVDPKQLPKQAAEQIGTNPVYEMDILADGRKKETHSEEATITITLPYTLQSVDAAERLVAFYVSEDGKLEPMRLSVYNEKNGTLTFRTNHLSMYTVNPINVSIDDVASNRWSAAFIDTVVARGLMSTTTNHMFQPETAATRAEFVHSVMKAFGWRGEQAEHPFTDVSTSDPVGASIAAAFNRGIIHGMSETHFGSDLTLSRQDMAVILQRALQAAAIPMSGSSIAPSFEDQEQIAAYALASIKKLRQAEIVSGDEHNMFLPEQPVTREQVAKLITELLERL